MKWVLAVALLCCGCTHPKAIADPTKPNDYIFMPDVSEGDRVCVYIPNEPPYDPSWRGLHCITIGDLRALLAKGLKAN